MQTIIGAFDDRDTAQAALEKLVAAGFDRSDVHVEHSDTSATAHRTASHHDDENKPGMISGFFSRLFGDDDASQLSGHYDEAVRRGSAVVVVDTQDETQAERAADILDSLGAYDIKDRAQQWKSSGWSGPEANVQDKSGVLNVMQEELEVGKRTLDRGGVRVIQRVSQQPVREIVRLREEHAVVERRPVDRPATAQDLAGFSEGSIEVRETREEPVVAKRSRVVEEVRVGKEVREREETIEDKLRRTDVDVERMDSQTHERAYAADQTNKPELSDGDMTERTGSRKTTGSKRTLKKDSPNS